MPLSIAHLGPTGTYSEWAAVLCSHWLSQTLHQSCDLQPYKKKSDALYAVNDGRADFAVVPVENSIEGTVRETLDTLWELNQLQIQRALVLPIAHSLLSHADQLDQIEEVRSHPQALAQCQSWLQCHVPQARCIAMNSTTEILEALKNHPTWAAIASQRAAQLYQLPILAYPINDYADNCTRFWLVSLAPSPGGKHTSLTFTLHDNKPGALLQALQILADHNINLSRIESRPTKRSLGDYLFFVDLEGDTHDRNIQTAIEELKTHTEILKILGSYDFLQLPQYITDKCESFEEH